MDQTPTNQPISIPKEEFDTSQEDTNLRTIQSQSPFDSAFSIVNKYRTRSSVVDLQLLKKSDHLKIKRSKGYIYYGEMIAGRRHGIGIIIFDDKRVFEGNWRTDRKNGLGYEEFPSGNRYEGEYVNGKPEGSGKYFWVNGEMYEGEWFNGLRNGHGVWRGTKNDSYIGQWKDNKPEGLGVHIWSNGDRYEGYFKECLKHGQGSQRYASGDLFKGKFQKGQKQGYGQYFWQTGGCYKGEFKDGIKNGKGYWESGGGDMYSGNYQNGKKHGFGIYTWTNGTIYKGNFEEDLRHGYGEIYWKDGSNYKGNWIKGEQVGQGQIFSPNSGQKRIKINKKSEKPIENNQDQYLQTKIDLKAHVRPFAQTNFAYKPKRYFEFAHKDIQRQRLASSENHKFHFKKSPQKCKTQGLSNEKWKTGVLVHRRRSKTRATQRDVQNLKLCLGNFKKHTVNFKQKTNSPVSQYKPDYKKQHIPHSSYYLHQIHKRIKTSNSNNPPQIFQPLESPFYQGKPYNLTKLMDKKKLVRYKTQHK